MRGFIFFIYDDDTVNMNIYCVYCVCLWTDDCEVLIYCVCCMLYDIRYDTHFFSKYRYSII
jgi:hypothetical protein